MASLWNNPFARIGACFSVLSAVALTLAPAAVADPPPDYIDGYVHSTDEYPIPRRMLLTTCSPEQLIAAAKVYAPMDFDRYMMEYKKHGEDLDQRAQERLHWFFDLPPGVTGPRRDVSEHLSSSFGDPLDVLYTDYARLFVNNKGTAAKMTDHCAQYPRSDQSVWDWRDDNSPVAYN